MLFYDSFAKRPVTRPFMGMDLPVSKRSGEKILKINDRRHSSQALNLTLCPALFII